MADAEYRDDTVRLEPGDMIVTYTDGVAEAMSPDTESAAAVSLAINQSGAASLWEWVNKTPASDRSSPRALSLAPARFQRAGPSC